MNDLLSQLRDIHLPTEVPGWPLAPGWWLLLFVVMSLLILIYWRVRKWRKDRRRYVTARSYLIKIEKEFKTSDDAQRLVRDLSIWLRRIALTLQAREKVAAVGGVEWLVCLDEIAGVELFQSDLGRIMLDAPYRRVPEVDAALLLKLCHQWLKASYA